MIVRSLNGSGAQSVRQLATIDPWPLGVEVAVMFDGMRDAKSQHSISTKGYFVGERRMAGSERVMPLKERPDTTTNTCSTEGAFNYPAQLYVTLSC
jgi:hypothetical protein